MGQRLDAYDRFPSGMKEYISQYGWHFSKKMCEWAVSKMKTKDESTGKQKKLDALKKDEVEELLKKYGIKPRRMQGTTVCMRPTWARRIIIRVSIADESHLALFIKDYIDDPDGYDGLPFTRFYADCIGSGTPIIWEDMM